MSIPIRLFHGDFGILRENDIIIYISNSGNTNAIVTLDLFANGQLLAFFSKNRDSQGVPYYNIPIGYSITMSMGATITATKEVNVYVYGELYN
jgi:hypothetical protein